MEDIYRITINKHTEFGIKSYTLPKTQHYLSRKSKIPLAQKLDHYYYAKKKAHEPDPTKYS